MDTTTLLLAGLGLLLVPVAGFARGRWQRVPGLATALGLVGAIILTARMLPWEATTVFCET